MSGQIIEPRTETVLLRQRAPHPLAVRLASFLGRLYGSEDLRGSGAMRIGEPAIGLRSKYAGYADSPQSFRGWRGPGGNPGGEMSGSIVGSLLTGLPGTQPPAGEPISQLQQMLMYGQGGPVPNRSRR